MGKCASLCCDSRNEEENKNPNIPNYQNTQMQAYQNVPKIKTELDKNLCYSVFRSLPKRETTDLQSFKDFISSKTNQISQKEKAYILFLWVCDNIIYDADAYFAGRKVDCEPEPVFRKGITVCSGYARLYQNIGQYIGLQIECVSCYSKGVGFEPGNKLTSTDHEYNIITLNNNYYPIDCTWGSGIIQEKKFTKKLNEFYFLADPELLIHTHFPANDKWQLTKKKYTLEEFLKWPQIKENFYAYGFNKYYPKEGFLELDTNSQKFTIWGNDISHNNANCQVFLLEGNVYQQQLNLDKINFYKDRIEYELIFNKQGRYKVKLFSNNDNGNTTHDIMTYIVNVHKNNKNELNYPYSYGEAKDINVIEPIYDNIKSGQKVKFKIKSNSNELDTIIIIDGKPWHYLNKDAKGYFEKEITIKSLPGENVIIGKRKDNNDNSCSFMISYKVK